MQNRTNEVQVCSIRKNITKHMTSYFLQMGGYNPQLPLHPLAKPLNHTIIHYYFV